MAHQCLRTRARWMLPPLTMPLQRLRLPPIWLLSLQPLPQLLVKPRQPPVNRSLTAFRRSIRPHWTLHRRPCHWLHTLQVLRFMVLQQDQSSLWLASLPRIGSLLFRGQASRYMVLQHLYLPLSHRRLANTLHRSPIPPQHNTRQYRPLCLNSSSAKSRTSLRAL